MAIYFICRDPSNFDEAERVLREEFNWTLNEGQYFGPHNGESFYGHRLRNLAQVQFPEFNSEMPLPKGEVPEAFSRLYDILHPTSLIDDGNRPISLSQLIQD
jgi:hypothetical protein